MLLLDMISYEYGNLCFCMCVKMSCFCVCSYFKSLLYMISHEYGKLFFGKCARMSYIGWSCIMGSGIKSVQLIGAYLTLHASF